MIATIGIILVQINQRTSVIHAFGHGFARFYPIQQGISHAVLAPHVLRYVFERVDGSRNLLASAFEIDPSSSTLDEQLIEEVSFVRDAFNLPTRLRDVQPVEKVDLPAIAKFIRNDDTLARSPDGINPTAEEIEGILLEAW